MKRNEVIQIRVSPEEKAQIEENAKLSHTSMSEHCRQRIFGLKATVTDAQIWGDPLKPMPRGHSPAEFNDKLFKKKVAQIMGKTNCSQDEAEAKVREELG